VATAFDDQTQIVLAGKVHRRDNVVRRLCRHGINARLRYPGVDPTRGLGQTDLITNVIGIFKLLEDIAA
jgi:hypothetical protein